MRFHRLLLISATACCLARAGLNDRADLLGGVVVLRGRALRDNGRPVSITAIPYYAWDNRKPGEMTIWIPETITPAMKEERRRLRRGTAGKTNTDG